MWAIVVAGGSGERFGQLKQFALLADRPVVPLGGRGLPAVGRRRRPGRASGRRGRAAAGPTRWWPGGATRAESVRRGLAAVPGDAEVIVVHDAARPWPPPALFASVVAAVTGEGPTGADLRRAGDRHHQAGGRRQDVDGHPRPERAGRRPDASGLPGRPAAAGPRLGGRRHRRRRPGRAARRYRVRVVPGDARNLKITTPADLRTAERLSRGLTMRIGQGLDVHPFSDDPHRPLVLGGRGHRGGARPGRAQRRGRRLPRPGRRRARRRRAWATWAATSPTPTRSGRGRTAWSC